MRATTKDTSPPRSRFSKHEEWDSDIIKWTVLWKERGVIIENLLSEHIAFIERLEQFKSTFRKTHLRDENRFEDDAQHSFHVALMAHVLSQYADRVIDVNRVCEMLLVHDIVELEAGDTFAYAEVGYQDKALRETKAAEHIYGALGEKGQEFHALWREFEEMQTDDALFANGIDRLQPILLNLQEDGGTWKEHGVPKEAILKRLAPLERISTPLYHLARTRIDEYFDEMEEKA